jgi:methanogenic corrinoid protein MtbC1
MVALVSRGVPASEAAAVASVEDTPIAGEASPSEEHLLIARMLQAAAAYDELQMTGAIREAMDGLDHATALDSVVMPALRRIGEAWGDQTLESANEHFTSEIVRREICRLISEVSAPGPDASSVLMACAEDERHDLGLLGLALLLRQAGIKVIYLGADVPASDVARAAAALKPEAVCLAAVLPGSVASSARALRALATGRLQPRLFAGGPALTGDSTEGGLPAVRLPQSLARAAEMIRASLLN